MGPKWPFLLMFESWVERHSFYAIETLNGYMYFIRLGQVGVQNKQNLYPRIPTTDVAKATAI